MPLFTMKNATKSLGEAVIEFKDKFNFLKSFTIFTI